jgi:hypothetical protein
VAPLEEVRDAIRRYGLLDEQVEFVVGYFADSLGSLRDRRFALIRLDSDSHDSVITSLEYLYPLLSPGGIIIIDDWHLIGCRFAVTAYRERYGIEDEVLTHAGRILGEGAGVSCTGSARGTARRRAAFERRRPIDKTSRSSSGDYPQQLLRRRQALRADALAHVFRHCSDFMARRRA